ncbi:MAG TPA: hypothetical protein PLN52_12595 [Opitutaceae bacterium]|nr:hypothetical protein [Opitutaceae bacterium]
MKTPKTSRLMFAWASLALLAGLGVARAQEKEKAAAPSAAPTQTQAQAAKPAVTVSGPTDRFSRSTLNAVSAGIPFNNPQPPKPAPAPAADPEDADDPKNGIVRLPSYIVQEQRPPVFRERDIYTKKGLGELATGRYFSESSKALNRFKIPFVGMGGEAYATMMYEEDERLREMEDTRQKIGVLRETDPVAADQMKREMDQTFIRRSQFSTPPGGSAK